MGAARQAAPWPSLAVVDEQGDFVPCLPDLRVATAAEYLYGPEWRSSRAVQVINLCDTSRYLGPGYYVSLLAEARGHPPKPGPGTLADGQVEPVLGHARTAPPRRRYAKPGIAILHDADEPHGPSNQKALGHFIAAARHLGLRTGILTREDLGRLREFDALFVRDHTALGHYTHAFIRRAEMAGMPVIDDSASLYRCNNKVYLHELFARHGIPVPRTVVVHRGNRQEVSGQLGFPCVLKRPDSSFSLDVFRVDSPADLHAGLDRLLEGSEMAIAQEWLPTEFDWRVGILDGRPLFACRYFMAPGHWQIVSHTGAGRYVEGKTEAVSLAEVPSEVVQTALAATRPIGSGFYGVDLKETDQGCVVMEVNDNPNVDAGNEDGVLKAALYREVMSVFARRIDEARRGQATAADVSRPKASRQRVHAHPMDC